VRAGTSLAALALTCAVVAGGGGPSHASAAPGVSMADVDAAARALGNRKADAVRLARVLLAQPSPAQVLHVRVDGVGTHEVAGLIVSGQKFHRRLDPQAFTAEVVSLVERTFAASTVEEVDVWAIVPLPYVKQQPVNGEYLHATDRIVYGTTASRSEADVAARLRRGTDVFWDPAWRRSLEAGQGAASARGQS
jgi:hypothetical protein